MSKPQKRWKIPKTKKINTRISIKDKSEEFLKEYWEYIVFVFKDYIYNKCWLSNIRSSKNLIGKLEFLWTVKRRDIRKYSTIIKRVLPCKENNEYKKLFCIKKFEQYEDEFYEIVCSSTNRIFGYFVSSKFHIVLIKDSHLKY